MGHTDETRQVLAAKFQAVFPHLDERQRRLVMGAEARSLGHGGIRLVARAAGVREVRCPPLSGQGSNRILIRKGTGSSAGETEKVHS